jgi:hypothetical protein
MSDSSTAIVKHYDHAIERFKDELLVVLHYAALKEKLPDIGILNGPDYIRDFSVAYERTNDLLAKIEGAYEAALLDADHEEAKAIFERAPAYFAENNVCVSNVKDSAALRKSYLALDELYIAAKEKVAALKALKKWLENTLESFKMAHDDAKKIYDKCAGGPYGKSGYDGMPSR